VKTEKNVYIQINNNQENRSQSTKKERIGRNSRKQSV